MLGFMVGGQRICWPFWIQICWQVNAEFAGHFDLEFTGNKRRYYAAQGFAFVIRSTPQIPMHELHVTAVLLEQDRFEIEFVLQD